MTNERKGEIAMLLIKNMIRKEGIKVNSMKRRISTEAAEIGVPSDEMLKFTHEVMREVLHEEFSRPIVSDESD